MSQIVAVKVSFQDALEEKIIKETLLFPFLGWISASLSSPATSEFFFLEQRLVIELFCFNGYLLGVQ